MISKIKNKIINLGLSFKKELILLISVNSVLVLCGILLPILTQQIAFVLFPICLIFIFNFGYYIRLNGLEQSRINDDIYDFVTVFTYFKIFIQNGSNVYTSLKEISQYANTRLSEQLAKLTTEMDTDKSVKPFVDFAHNYKDLLVEQIMLSIYQMIDEGNQGINLVNFETIFDKYADIIHANKISEKDKKLSSLTAAPLIGSALLILMVTFGVLLVIGEMVNGI